MAKDIFKKRKLDQDQADQSATPKRLKPSKSGDSGKKDGTNVNGDGAVTPSTVGRKASKTANGQSRAVSTPGETPKTGAKSASKSNGQPTQTQSIATPTSAGKSKKEKRRHPSQGAQELSTGPQNEAAASKPTPSKPTHDDSSQITPGTSKKSRKDKRKSHGQNQSALVKLENEDAEAGAAQKKSADDTENQLRSREAKERRLAEIESSKTPNQHGWWLSAPSAGRFLDHDPIFVQDEKANQYLVAATSRSIQLLALQTSLSVRSHIAPDGRSITAYCQSTGDLHGVDVAYDNGTKLQWNWITGEVVKGTFPAQEEIVAMTTTTLANGNSELFYTTENDGSFSVVGERNALYTTERRLKDIRVMHEGAYIICLSTSALVLGARESPEPQSAYTWTEIPVEMPIRCLDARLVFKLNSKKQTQRPELALAIGNAEGQIRLYNNITSVLGGPGSQAQVPRSRVLHWHREPVSTVKFSKDGNYLISGGKETVLVIWQLETGKQQFLPHLTAEIERLVVSPDGAQYALQMGDNSIMVLSTSELKAVANFAGLQLPQITDEMSAQGIDLPKTTALLHPQDSHRLLLSVPSTQPKTVQDTSTRPFLQAFDIRHSRHVLRQALTRNNVTDFNLGPEQTPIMPPDVSHLAISPDGRWLATVDEWIPPAADLEHHVPRRSQLDSEDVKEVQEEQEDKREVFLKFWRWNDDKQMWTLSTRADAPHAPDVHAYPGPGAGRVLKLVADPSGNSFATIGEDSVVKIWRPKTRTRHGVPVEEQDGTEAVDWACKRTIPLHISARMPERADSPMDDVDDRLAPQPLIDACLAFSPDGSMLACGQVTLDDNALPMIHFISTQTGKITASKPGLVSPEQDLIDVAFLDRFFISLSVGSVRVWNLVDDSHVYTIALNENLDAQEDAMLAVNHTDDTFAVVSYVDPDGPEAARPKLEVYHPKRPECLFAAELTSMPAALLAGTGTRGFTVVFEDGTIRTVSSTASAAHRQELSLPTKENESLALPSAETASALALIEQQAEDSKPLALPAGEYTRAEEAVVEDDRRVVRPEQLALISDVGMSSSMPVLTEMFQNIVGLYGRKPRDHALKKEEDLMEM